MLSIQIDPKTLISLTSICPFLQALWKRIFPIFRCCTVIRYFKVLDKEGLKAKNDIYWQKLHCLLRTSVWYWINQGRSLSGKNREKQTFPARELALQIPILPLIDFGCDRITDFRKPPRLLDTKKWQDLWTYAVFPAYVWSQLGLPGLIFCRSSRLRLADWYSAIRVCDRGVTWTGGLGTPWYFGLLTHHRLFARLTHMSLENKKAIR